MNLAAFAEGHINGKSVTPEIFANQDEARRLTTAAWEQIFTLGRARVATMAEVSNQIEAAQAGKAETRREEAQRAA